MNEGIFETGMASSLSVVASTNKITSDVDHLPKSESRRVLKNIIVVSFGFSLLFISFNSISFLQSSLYPEGGLGTFGSATIYVFLVLSSLLVPTYAIRKLTSKWTMVLAMSGYTFYIGAQFHPNFATILPTAALLGFCAAPLWASKSFYLTHIGNKYSAILKDTNPEAILARFFGIFFCIFQSFQVLGQLISSFVFSSGYNWTPNSTQLEKCGASFCPGDLFHEVDEAAFNELKIRINILSGICVGIALSGIAFIAIFLDSLNRYGETERIEELEKAGSGTLQNLIATFRQMKKPYQLLLIPITIFIGLERSYLGADFTQAFITCSWGVEHVGYVLICYAGINASVSIAVGPISRKIGRTPLFILGAIFNAAMIMVYFLWKPNPEIAVVYFAIAGFWGTADAIWQTQMNAFCGYIFPDEEEAAFSNFRLWESIGYIIGYANSSISCMRPKLYILTVFLIVGMICLLVIEFNERQLRKGKKLSDKDISFRNNNKTVKHI